MKQETIERMKQLDNEGKTQIEIAQLIGLTQRVVSYWLGSKENRKEISNRVMDRFRKLPISQRRLIYKKRTKYIRDYLRKKYNEDQKFREKVKERVRKRYKSKQEVKK